MSSNYSKQGSIDGNELQSLFYQAKTFMPHLRKQLQIYKNLQHARTSSNSISSQDTTIDGHKIIDIGCGPMPSLGVILSELPNSSFLAVDFDTSWIECSKKLHPEKNIEFLCLDLSQAASATRSSSKSSSWNKITSNHYNLALCLFSKQALNHLFSHSEVEVRVEFILIHLFTTFPTKKCPEMTQQAYITHFMRENFADRIREHFTVKSFFKCEVELEEILLQELKQKARKNTQQKKLIGCSNSQPAQKDVKIGPCGGNEKLHFVSTLLKSNYLSNGAETT